MRKRFGGVLLAVVAMLVGASSATAATEFGDGCAGDEAVTTPYTLTTLSASPAALSLTAPISGVITKVKVQIGIPLPLAIPEQVKLLKAAGGNNYTVTNQTTVPAGSGLTAVDARMPVQTGERLAVHGLPFSYEGTAYTGYEFYCKAVPGSVLGAVPGDVPAGTTAEFVPATTGSVPLTAVIEPDADNDGYGDETQDKCPQSATTQAPCPAVTLSATGTARKGLATMSVTASLQASVTVAGTVKLGKGKTTELNGGTQVVAPGVLAKFVLLFPKKLQSALKALPRKRSLTLNVTASAPNVVGAPTTTTLKLHLKGQAKPKRHGHKKRA